MPPSFGAAMPNPVQPDLRSAVLQHVIWADPLPVDKSAEEVLHKQVFQTAVIPRNPSAFGELVESKLVEGQLQHAQLLWWLSPFSFHQMPQAQCTELVATSCHARIARAAMDMAELELARTVLQDIPAPMRVHYSAVKDLWNRLSFRLEARDMPIALFPEDGPFERRWTPDGYGTPPESRKQARVRYLGRLELHEGADHVCLAIAPAPKGAVEDHRPRFIRAKMKLDKFLRAANIQRLEPEMHGLFLESLEVEGTPRIYLKPRRTR